MTKLTTLGMHHLALYVKNLENTVAFYTNVLQMEIEWQPDADNVYLTTAGTDNLALHRAPADFSPSPHQRLDHFGFILASEDEVDAWYERFLEHKVEIKAKPRTHRDGARSFYAADPDGNVLQMIYHPPIANRA